LVKKTRTERSWLPLLIPYLQNPSINKTDEKKAIGLSGGAVWL
jgi:hypothetical protein